MHRLKRQTGLSLLELIIVVAVLGLIAALAIPNLTRARLNTNESLSKNMLKNISTAMETYRTAQSVPTYAGNLTHLTNGNPPFLEVTLDTSNTFSKSGYDFELVISGTFNYTVHADPETEGVSGNQIFCIDASGEISSSTSDAPFDTLTTVCQLA